MSNNFFWKVNVGRVVKQIKKRCSVNPVTGTEYSTGITFKDKEVFFQFVEVSGRIQSSTGLKIIEGVDTLLYQNLSLVIDNKTWFLPYIHTNNVGVVLQLVNNVLYVISQASGFAGNYVTKGLVLYTKNN